MKTHYLILINVLLLGGLTSCTNGKSPDKNVEKTFKGLFPKAKHVEWEVKTGYYVAEFAEYGYKKEAWFDEEGEWWLTKKELTAKVPYLVKQSLVHSGYGNWTIDEVDYVEVKRNDSFYMVEVEKADDKRILYFSTSGELMEKLPNMDILRIVFTY